MKRIITLSLIAIVAIFCIGQEKKENYNSKAVKMNSKAVELMQRFKNDSAALILIDKAIELDKTYYLPHLTKGIIYLNRNDLNKALFEWETGINLKPDCSECWLMAAMIYDLKGETKNALKYYQKCIDLVDTKISDPKKID